MATTPEFTTIRTADLIDALAEAVDAARVQAGASQRWQNAIDAAWDHLLQAETIEYRHSDHALRYRSESGQSYTANGTCQCTAFEKGQPCKHRAAARIVFRALELAETAGQARRRELAALGGELYEEALELGHDWTVAQDRAALAAALLPELEAFALEWNASAVAASVAALN